MTCYYPLSALQLRPSVAILSDRYSHLDKICFSVRRKYEHLYDAVQLPCGQCIGCRQLRSSQWAIRCVHEAQLHARNCFITLTFNDAHLPSHGLDHSIFQLFMKRLRKRYGAGIRYYMCGEYGDQYGRPHFHACIFGLDFSDKKLWSVRNGVRLYTSDDLSSLWSDPVSGLSMGFTTVGDVTLESAGYIARYILKRVTGDDADEHYRGRMPEYNRMSLKPGIGQPWFDKYGMSDVFPHDRIIHKGKQMSVPRYYSQLLERVDPYLLDDVKFNRYLSAMKSIDDNGPDRLRVKEAVHFAKLKTLVRGVDHVT